MGLVFGGICYVLDTFVFHLTDIGRLGSDYRVLAVHVQCIHMYVHTYVNNY